MQLVIMALQAVCDGDGDGGDGGGRLGGDYEFVESADAIASRTVETDIGVETLVDADD